MKYSSMAVFKWNDDICQNINIDCMRGYIENCHPEKTNVDRGEALVYIRFQGVTFPMLSSPAVNNYDIILNVI